MVPPAERGRTGARVGCVAHALRMRGALLGVLAAGAVAAPAQAATADAGALRGTVDDVSGAMRFGDVLAESPAVRAGFRTPAGWFAATRARRVAVEGGAVVAELATDDPLGRVVRLRMARDADGVVAVTLAASGADVLETRIGFGARPDERYLGFGERSNAVDQRGNEVEAGEPGVKPLPSTEEERAERFTREREPSERG